MDIHMTTRQETSGKSVSQKRHGGDVVPVPTGSSSRDRPPEELPARSSGEFASVRVGSGSRKDSSSSSAKSMLSVGSPSVPSVRTSEEERMSVEREGEEDERPEDWVPSYLPRYTKLIDKTVRWEGYHDKAWQMEGVVANIRSDRKEWKKERAKWKKEKKKMNEGLDELVLSILGMRDLEESEEKLKKRVLELEKEVEGMKEKEKEMGCMKSTQTGFILEQAHFSGRVTTLDEKVEKMAVEVT